MSKPQLVQQQKSGCARDGKPTVNVNIGPWTSSKSVETAKRDRLTAAMSDEAWKTVEKSCDFTPVKPPQEKASGKGYTILGNLVKVNPLGGRNVEVVATYSVTVDGQISTAAILEGRGTAQGSMGAEDALRAVTERRVLTILEAIKAGRVLKLK